MSVPTPHNSAKLGDIAKTVLMPGDPMRAEYIADNFLSEPMLVNNVRGVRGYTGSWKEKPVSVMASGMGIPSMGIYSWELYNCYEVDNIIRIGTAGALDDRLKLKDIVIGIGACTDSNFMYQYGLNGNFSATADYELLKAAEFTAKKAGIKPYIGTLLSSDIFYSDMEHVYDNWKKMGILAVDMEAAGLYATAARAGKRALTICTVSNHIYRAECMPAVERQNSLDQMIEIALDTAISINSL